MAFCGGVWNLGCVGVGAVVLIPVLAIFGGHKGMWRDKDGG